MGVDYDSIAGAYDAHRQGAGLYMQTLLRLAKAQPVRRALELGAGTGNNTGAFLKAAPCSLIALDPSRGMLDQARGKAISAHWVRAAAQHAPFLPGVFDFIFGVYMIHYIPDLRALFRECRRILRGGTIAFVTAPHPFIREHPMNAYFPSFSHIDLARFQSEDEILDAMHDAGFHDIGAELLVADPRPIDRAYVDRVAGKFVSTYALLPPDEFEQGLARLRAEVAEKGRLDTPLEWKTVTVWGRI